MIVIHENAVARMIDGFRVIQGKKDGRVVFVASGPNGHGWGLTASEAMHAAS